MQKLAVKLDVYKGIFYKGKTVELKKVCHPNNIFLEVKT